MNYFRNSFEKFFTNSLGLDSRNYSSFLQKFQDEPSLDFLSNSFMDFLERTSGILLKNLWVMLPGTTLEIYFSNNSRDALGFLRNSCKISYKAFILQKHYRIIIKFLLRFVEKTLQNLSQNFLKNFFFQKYFQRFLQRFLKKPSTNFRIPPWNVQKSLQCISLTDSFKNSFSNLFKKSFRDS